MQLPGWTLIVGRLTSDQTPAGLVARGGEMKGRCQTGECRRIVTLDAQDWIARGYVNTSLAELTRTYRCGRIGCKLHFDESYVDGLPLQTCVGGFETAVITCNRCMRVTTLPVERLVQRLLCTGAGAGNTGCRVFAAAIKAPCRYCGAVRWTGEIKRPTPAALRSSQLTVFAAAAVDPSDDRLRVPVRLARHARTRARKRVAATGRDLAAANFTVRWPIARRHPRACDRDRVGDRVVDLILDRAVARPTSSHVRFFSQPGGLLNA